MKSSVSKNCSESNLQYLRPFESQEKEKLQEAKEEWQLSAVRAVKRVKPAATSSQTCNNSTSDTSERLGLVKPAATLQLLEPSSYTQQCLRHNQRSAWFCSDQISLGSDISLTSDLSAGMHGAFLGRGGAVLKIFRAGAVRGSYFSRGWRVACIPVSQRGLAWS